VPRHIYKDERVALLRGVDLLSGCSKEELRRIASITTEMEAHAGQVLAEQGTPGREFFIIISGKARAERSGVALATLTPTTFFGELALLDGRVRTATVVAESDLRLLVLSLGEFRHLCRNYPSVTQKMLAELASRLRKADEMLGVAKISDAPAHVTL